MSGSSGIDGSIVQVQLMRRLLLATLGIVALLLVIAAMALLWLLSGDGVRRSLEREASAWLDQPVRIGSASVRLLPRVTLRLRDVEVGEPGQVTLAEIDVSARPGPLFSRRIEDAELLIADSRLVMPFPFAWPSGSSEQSAGTDEGGSDGIDLVSVRNISLRNVTVASRGREIQISATSSLVDTKLTIASFEATTGSTRLEASGTATLSPRLDATVQARANALDVDDLIALAAAFTPVSGQPSAVSGPGIRVKATVEAAEGRLAGVTIGRIEAQMLMDGDGLIVDPIAFTVFGGAQNGWLDIRFGEALDVRIGTSATNIDVAQLAAFGGAPGSVTGRLDGSGRFGARGRDLPSVLGSARGVGQVMIGKGSMRGLNVVQTAVRFLGGAAAAEDANDDERFDELVATFALGDGVLRSDDLSVRAPDYDILARGTLTLATDALDARADLVLSEALSATAGRDLFRYARAGNRIVLPATIGGTIARLRLGIDAAAALRRGVRNEIERRLEGLLERIRPF
jgi:uncharacterized protein YhdP